MTKMSYIVLDLPSRKIVKRFETEKDANKYIENAFKFLAHQEVNRDFIEEWDGNFEHWKKLSFSMIYSDKKFDIFEKILEFIDYIDGKIVIRDMYKEIYHWYEPKRDFLVEFVEISTSVEYN